MVEMSDACMVIHKKLDTLPMFKFPFNSELIPENGIYFFYEEGEHWGHGGSMQRVVHVDTNIDKRLVEEIEAHFGNEFRRMHLTNSMHKAISSKRKITESEFIKMAREHLSFRFIVLGKDSAKSGIEKYLAKVLAECLYCTPSRDWIGNSSDEKQVRDSGMWKVHKTDHTMTKEEEKLFEKAVGDTYKWLEKKGILAPVLRY